MKTIRNNIGTRKQKLTSQAASRKQIPNRNIRNTAANLARASGQVRASRQYFASKLPEQLFELKKWRRH